MVGGTRGARILNLQGTAARPRRRSRRRRRRRRRRRHRRLRRRSRAEPMSRLAGGTGLSTKMRFPLIGRGSKLLSSEAATPKDVTSSLNRRLMRVLRDVKTPTVSKLIEQRKGYARKRRDGQASAGSSKTVHDTCEVEVMNTLHEALRRYDDGVLAGLELHDRKTVSLLVTACSLPGTLWADEQLPRALGLFERTWSADSIDPRARLDRPSDSVRVRNGSEPHADAAAPVSLQPVMPRCSHLECGEVAAYGSAVSGLARSCARHSAPSEVRVELDNMALNVLSESCVRRGGMLEYGGPCTCYAHAMHMLCTCTCTCCPPRLAPVHTLCTCCVHVHAHAHARAHVHAVQARGCCSTSSRGRAREGVPSTGTTPRTPTTYCTH